MRTLVFTILLAGIAASALGQIINDPNADTITIVASDGVASETGPDPGLFIIQRQRQGPTDYAITVFYEISGTASNGVDYESIASTVRIEAGSVFAAIPINPIPDNLIEGNETVRLRILPSPLLCPAPTAPCSYKIGFPATAIVTISDVSEPPPTNHPPVVRLNSPHNGDQFMAGADIPLRAYAQDVEDGNDLIVEFFAGDHSLGFGTFVPTLCPAPECPYFALVWSNAPAGDYVITAKATDSKKATAGSDPAFISVLDGVNIFASDPDATEVPLTVAAAPDPARFVVRRAETNESIVVYYHIGGTASNGIDYEKLSGEVSIPAGATTAEIVVMPIDDQLFEETETVELMLIAPCPQCLFANPPCEVPQGTNCYPIGSRNKAVAFIHDNDRPSSNDLPVVTIVAVDPIAVEGAFCPSNWWWTAPTTTGGWTTNNSTILPPCPGTNTALFEVRRHGPTNADLTVYYAIGGTATEGVDYKPLRNSATVPSVVIPAGRYAARIQIIPIDDTIPEGIETVVLGLTATTRPPEYLFGRPRQAAAIILDNDQPRPYCRRLPDGLFHLCAPGADGSSYTVLSSNDLVIWTEECSNVVTDGAIHFIDPDAAGLVRRFYKVVPDATPAPPP